MNRYHIGYWHVLCSRYPIWKNPKPHIGLAGPIWGIPSIWCRVGDTIPIRYRYPCRIGSGVARGIDGLYRLSGVRDPGILAEAV